MGARSYVKDAPEIQCFKKYPEIPFGAGKSFLYYCDKPQYLKYCEKYDKDEESRKAYAKYVKDHIHEIFFLATRQRCEPSRTLDYTAFTV